MYTSLVNQSYNRPLCAIIELSTERPYVAQTLSHSLKPNHFAHLNAQTSPEEDDVDEVYKEKERRIESEGHDRK